MSMEMEEPVKVFNWLFTEEQLRKTPSVKEGLRLEHELMFRQKQAMLMQTIGQKSGLTQLAINTSVIFMHRFYMFRKIKFFPRIHVAIGFVFAAGKVEESARKLEHLIRYTIDIIRSNKNGEFLDKRDKLTYEMDCEWKEKIDSLIQSNCDVSSPAYDEMRKSVLECETEIYAVIGFHLEIVHPHNFVIRMSGLLEAENIKDISQYAYNLANVSSQLTMLNLKYKPELIATVCLNIAAKAHAVKFQCMKDPSINWYQVYDPSADFKEIESVSEEFLNLIKACPLLPSWMTNLARGVNASRSANRSVPPGSKPVPSAHPHKPGPPTGHHHHPPHSSHSRDPSKQSSQSHHHSSDPSNQSASTVASSSAAPNLATGGTGTPPVPVTSSSHSTHRSSLDPHSSHHRDSRPPATGAISSSSQRPPSSNRHHPYHNQNPQHQRSQQPGAQRSSGHHKPIPNSSSNNRPPSHPMSSSSRQPSSRPPPNPALTSSSSSLSHPSKMEYSRRPDPSNLQSQSLTEDSKHLQPSHSLDKSTISNSSSAGETRRSTPPVLKAATAPVTLNTLPQQSGDASFHDTTDFLASPSESNNGSQLSESSKPASLAPKLSLSSYRERFAGKSRPGTTSSQSESVTDDSGINTAASEENCSMEIAVDSPKDSKPSDLASFNIPHNSPTNARLKLKVKRESSSSSSSSDKHSIKFADTGLKIKIKPMKSEMKEEELAGPSGVRSATPIEEGEVVDSPSSTGSSDRKSDGSLKIRLNISKRGEEELNGQSGDNGDSSNSHRSHHHNSHHHRRHHHHKSKKHSKQSSRHEGKSSKRPSEHHDERSSKSSRMSTETQQSHSSLRGSFNHQNSGGFSIDAFSSTMPSNIFEDEETGPPPITPTPDMVQGHRLYRPSSSTSRNTSTPPGHQQFHQLMAQHWANEARKPPLPPLPSSTHPPPPPPPPPPHSPPSLI